MRKHKKDNGFTGISVKVYNNNIEKALKKFKKMVKDSNLMIELRDRKYYEKKSSEKRRKNGLANLRNKYRTQKENS